MIGDRPTIGVDLGAARGRRTGIANYTIHMLGALVAADAGYRYIGFVGARARVLDGDSLADRAAAELLFGGGLAAPIAAVAAGLSRLPGARRLHRAVEGRRFAAAARRRELDLFHAFRFRPLADPGVPVLPVVHDLSTFRHPQWHPKARVRELDRLGDALVRAALVQTVSEFSKREIVALFGIDPARIVVAPPAAGPAFFHAGRAATEPDLAALDLAYGEFFLTVGTREPRKNLRTVVAAHAGLSAAERARCPLVVVGGQGWGALELPREAARLCAEGGLRLLGEVSDTRLRSLYEGARLLLMPSHYEGFGMPVVEALACGTAVAHSAGTAMDEISGQLGRRIAATDVAEWTVALREAMADGAATPAALDARIAQARRFDWAASAERVIAAYAQLIPR